MSRDLNKWMGIGRLGKDVELRFMPSGGAVANISIACGGDYKDKNTGQKVEVTEWVPIVLFNRLGEIAGEYLKKGSKVYVEGSLRTRKWQNQQGVDQYTTEIVASELQMLDSKGDNTQGGQQQAPQSQQAQRQSQGAPQQQQAPQQPPNDFDNFDPNIPF